MSNTTVPSQNATERDVNRISPEIFILTQRDMDDREQRAYQRGVERGKFEASSAWTNGPYARNCANWKKGECQTCGSQTQGMEVHADYKCPHFVQR